MALYDEVMERARLQRRGEKDIMRNFDMQDYYAPQGVHENVLRRAQAEYARSPSNPLGDNVLEQLPSYKGIDTGYPWLDAMRQVGVNPQPEEGPIWDAAVAEQERMREEAAASAVEGAGYPWENRSAQYMQGQDFSGVPDATILTDANGRTVYIYEGHAFYEDDLPEIRASQGMYDERKPTRIPPNPAGRYYQEVEQPPNRSTYSPFGAEGAGFGLSGSTDFSPHSGLMNPRRS